MQLESVTSPHGPLSIRGKTFEHLVETAPHIMAHRNHRAVNERYPGALAESLQPHEKHKREEDARHEFHEAVVGYGGREILGKMPLDDFERYFNTKIEQFENSEVTTLTGFFLERQYDLKVGQPIRVDSFSFIPLDLQNAYVNKFKVIYIKPKKNKDNQKDN